MKTLETILYTIRRLLIVLIILIFFVIYFDGMSTLVLNITIIIAVVLVIGGLVYCFYKKSRRVVYQVSDAKYSLATVRKVFHYNEKLLKNAKVHYVTKEKTVDGRCHHCIFVPKKDLAKAKLIIEELCED